MGKLAPLAALRIKAMQPQALGELIDVPFMSWFFDWFHRGMGAMAPPGATMLTPQSPSVVGPTLLQE